MAQDSKTNYSNDLERLAGNIFSRSISKHQGNAFDVFLAELTAEHSYRQAKIFMVYLQTMDKG